MRNILKKITWVLKSFPKIAFCKIKQGKRVHIDYFVHIERRARLTLLVGSGVLTIGRGTHIKNETEIHLSGKGNLMIGEHVCINSNCYIASQEKVEIGPGCELGPNVVIVDHDHDFRIKGGIRAGKYKKSSIIIGKNVWIGANTVVLRGTEIGDDCVIGAGSVISGRYPAHTIVVQKREEKKILYE